MQSNYWPAASASSKPDSSTAADTTNIKQISLVIIRLELDNCVDEEDPILLSSPERDIYTIFNYHSAAYYNKQRTASVKEASLSDYSEKTNQEDLLKTFIGKRQSHLIRIETYDFNEMSANKNSQGQNALTISSALETAYSDWNKNATSSSDPKLDENQESSSVVKAENIQPNQEESMPEQELPKESTQESTETSTSQKEEDKEDRSLTESKLTKETNEEKKTPEKEIPPVKSESTTKSKKSKKHQDGKSNKEEKPPSPIIKQSDSNTTEISFYYGNPTVDIVKGFLHIYKDTTLTPLIDDVNESKRDSKGFSPKQSTLVPSNRSEMLCMIGIPANVGCNELLDFIMPFNETIDYMRIVRDNSPNQYMALIKFKNQKDTDSFYLHNNNRLFNSIEDSVCHLVFVERIEAMNSSKGASLPIPGFTELPTCYICLERMDESLNGVITILCNHSFHANCLSKWGDTCCPVCRYSQTPEYELDNMCSECGSHENLWICLICGHVGCGRYVRGHAYDHFQLTQHTYSMQMGNNRVWDYAADNYVHRLIQNKTDGKLVQLDEGGRVINQDEKIDSITLEYTYLLTTQLESQRLFFEEKMQIVEDKYKSQILDLESKTKQLESENTDLKQNQSQMIKEKSNIEKKCSTLSSKLTKMQSDLEEEKELNKCLSSNQEVYQGKLAKMEENLKKLSQEKDSEIAELKSQLKDIMFYLDAQSKIAESKDVTKEEIDQSQLVIQQNQATGSNAEGQSRRGKKKK